MTQVIDEKTHNEAWLEAARENYETAMESEDWATALAVIDDIKDAYGPTAGIILSRDFIRRKTSVSARNPMDAVATQMNIITKALYGVEPYKENNNEEEVW